MRSRSLLDRKAILRAAVEGLKRIRYVDHGDEIGMTLFEVADQLGLEGIVAKRADAPYPRGGDWVTIKTVHGRLVDERRRDWMRVRHRALHLSSTL